MDCCIKFCLIGRKECTVPWLVWHPLTITATLPCFRRREYYGGDCAIMFFSTVISRGAVIGHASGVSSSLFEGNHVWASVWEGTLGHLGPQTLRNFPEGGTLMWHRSVIADAVAADPETYSEGFLGKPNPEYRAWIRNPQHWGGAIELSILSS
jgi:hypothetical protein